MGDPAHVAERIEFAKLPQVKSALGKAIKWEQEDLYGYDRAFANSSVGEPTGLTILDPTAGGGSIPFEALRLGHTVIANALNPVAATILWQILKALRLRCAGRQAGQGKGRSQGAQSKACARATR